MRPASLKVGLAATAALFLAGCDLITDIFAAGFWVGVILVVVILIGVFLVVRMLR